MARNPLSVALDPLTKRFRTDVTAKKVKGGNSIWTKEPLTDELMERHMNGGAARGCAFIKPGESTTKVSTLDLDSHKGEIPWETMQQVAGDIVDSMQKVGMRPVAFSSSGGSGIHIITLWDTPQDAYSVRQLMAAILETTGFSEGTGGVDKKQIEIFPKQDRVDVGSYGNQCILPLAGKSVPLEALLGFERMSREHITTVQWEVSDNVPIMVKPVSTRSASGSVTMAELVEALSHIPNSGELELDYDKWRDVVFGIHHATGGSAEGLALATEFSKKSGKYNKATLEQRTWPYIKVKDGGVTGRTVLAIARECGWEGVPDVFEAVPTDTPTGVPQDAIPKFRRDGRGAIEASLLNCLMALRSPTYSGMVIRHDTFKDEVVFAKSGSDQYQIFGDADYVGLREVLERRGFKSIGRELIRDVVGKIANENQFDTATEWLGQQAWDGVPRVESFLADHFGVIDSPYMRAVGRYIWTALAGRIVQPGVKADIAPIFIGGQGVRKTTAVENMSPDKAFFAEFNLADRDADMSRKMRGRLVGEIGELRGLHTKDLESIKSFLSQTHEKWTPKFKEFETTFPRRLIFFGTTNQREFLSDPTGSRRFAPIMVGERPDIVEHDLAHSTEALKHLKWKIDTDAIADARDQLWAEGAVLFKNGGVDYSEIEILAERTHAEHTLSDPWAEIVNEWLDAVDGITGEIPRTRKFLRTVDVLQECLAFDVKGINRLQEMRIASVLRQIGYSRRKQRIGQVTAWVFVPT